MTDEQRTGLHPAIPGGLAGVLFLLACIPFAIGWHQLAAARRAESWLSTGGTVTTSRVVESSYRDETDGSWQTTAQLELGYEYTVDGRTRRGTGMEPSGSVSRDAAEAEARFATGAPVEVWYDPRNPDRAALLRESSTSGYVLLAAGALLVLLGLLFGFLALKLLRG